jgi:glycerophosphoryl diester phosphodiesterase
MHGDWPYPFWIAHRGAGTLAPENTLAAFRLGAQHGYRCFECDVKLSADGVPFLMHDATLERTTSGRGTAGDLPWAALSQLDAGSWHGRGHAGEPLPTLAQPGALGARQRLHADLEIKPTPGHEEATGPSWRRQVRALWAGATVPPLLSSFRPDALRTAMEAAPELPRGLLLDELWPGWDGVAQALAARAVITNHVLMDSALVQRLHAAGRRALCYTVNEPADAQGLIEAGVDGLITDAVDRFAPAAR